jgi:hypothetical protein
VSMFYLPTQTFYGNCQLGFVKACLTPQEIYNFSSGMAEEKRRRFHAWLAEQGCVVVEHKPAFSGLIRNGLGVAPGYDRFGFERDQDRVLFALRWA